MVGWLVCKGMPVTIFFEGGNVESTVGFQTRCEVLLQMVPRYLQIPVSQKGALLGEIVDTIPSCGCVWKVPTCPESGQIPFSLDCLSLTRSKSSFEVLKITCSLFVLKFALIKLQSSIELTNRNLYRNAGKMDCVTRSIVAIEPCVRIV